MLAFFTVTLPKVPSQQNKFGPGTEIIWSQVAMMLEFKHGVLSFNDNTSGYL